MQNRVLLIDGHSIINRAFYGIRDLTNAEGIHTNAIYGFLNIFFSVYAKVQPEYILVAFDVKEKTFRHKMYPEYKGTRKPMPQELHEQVPILKEILHAMKIPTAELPGYEADDLLGSYAKLATQSGFSTVILSGDRDLLQLASEEVMISLPKTKAGKTEYEEYFADDVKNKYGVTPAEFIDMKALMGDTSDNIPGIPGIGEKTAAAIIMQYHSLENAIAHADAIKPKKASENLQTYAEQGRMSKVLATINVDSPVPVPLEDARIADESVFYNENSYQLYKKLELNRLLNRFDQKDLLVKEELDFQVFPAEEFHPASYAHKKIGLYLDESASLLSIYDAEDGAKIYTSFSTSSDKRNDNSDQLSFSFAPIGILKDAVYQLLDLCSEIYVFGCKKLLHTLRVSGFSSDRIYDIEILAYLLNPLASSYSYDQVAKDYLNQIIPSTQDLIGKQSLSSAIQVADQQNLCFQIAVYHARTAFQAFPALHEKLEEEEMWDLFLNIEMPLVYSLYDMEQRGVQVDRERLYDFSVYLGEEEKTLEKEIYAEAGEEFNINSPMQLGHILFEKLGLPSSKKTKKGYSTSAEVLEKLAPDYPIVNQILKYRQIAKLKSTYADGLVSFISPDGRIHGTFNQTITATGRISSTEPNLQNIPIRMELGQEIRKAFTAKEGCVFLDADYSQIELRLLAHMSGDQNLIEAYNTEADIHRITASKVFHIPYDEVTKEQRRNAKAVNFGIVYGISSFGLSQDLSISRKQAAEYIRQYFDTYPGIKKYLDATVRKAKSDGYVTSMFGRRRPIPELSSGNFMQRSFGERAAMNSPLQGSAADIMKIAMINVDRALKKANLQSAIVLQIHDELLVETVVEEIDQVREILTNEMKNAAHLSVVLEVDVQQGSDWYEAH